MKILVTIIFLLSFHWVFGTIHTVDNNAGATANFSSVSDAISNAEEGDTIYIHKSMVSYGNFNINKRVVILGPGHHSEGLENVNATVGIISLLTGSSGTYIGGLQISSINVNAFAVTNDITIENNLFTGSSAITGPSATNAMGDNWIISGNIFNPASGCGGCKLINVNTGNAQNGPNMNWIINNNLIRNVPPCCGGVSFYFDNLNASTLIINNTFIMSSDSYVFSSSGVNQDATFMNNIFYSSGFEDNISDNCTDCIFDYNLTYSTSLELPDLPGSDNLNNQEPVFVNVPDLSVWKVVDDYNLAVGSPGKEAGSDDKDMGLYGGEYNFSKYGFPPGLPIVTEFDILNPIIVSEQELVIKVKAKTGN